MEEALFNAKSELKRADHLIYVSLKYTRTVDVIKSIIERLLNCYDFLFEALLKKAKEEGKVPAVPSLPRLKIDFLTRLYTDDEIMQNYLKFYTLLRKVDKAEFARRQEFRRHVTMIANVDEEKIEITIDIISDYFTKTKEFMRMVEELIYGPKS